MKIYKITIEEINRCETNKTKEMFFHKLEPELNKEITWYEHHNLPEEEQKNYYAKEIETQETEIKETEQTIYEQELTDLNIGELAIYINKAK